MNILCLIGIHKFEWYPHERPLGQWTYILWCARGCGNLSVRLCLRDEHGGHPDVR